MLVWHMAQALDMVVWRTVKAWYMALVLDMVKVWAMALVLDMVPVLHTAKVWAMVPELPLTTKRWR